MQDIKIDTRNGKNSLVYLIESNISSENVVDPTNCSRDWEKK